MILTGSRHSPVDFELEIWGEQVQLTAVLYLY